jgi:hypothetical protein
VITLAAALVTPVYTARVVVAAIRTFDRDQAHI